MQSKHQKVKVFVVGGSGFIGTRLVEKLLANDYEVTIYDIAPSTRYSDHCIIGNVCDESALVRSMRHHDVVINLAAEHKDDITPKSLYYDTNVSGMANILSAAEINGINRIVFTSSVAVYPLDTINPTENTKPEPFNDYGKSKVQAEKLIEKWATKQQNTYLIVRPAVVIGEGNLGNVNNLIKQINSGVFIMVGNGLNKKSMCYVGNLVEFLCQRIQFNKNELLNFADKPDLSSLQIVETIKSILGLSNPVIDHIKVPYMLAILVATVLDGISKLLPVNLPVSRIRIRKFVADTVINVQRLQNTGFVPPTSLKLGLELMIRNNFKA